MALSETDEKFLILESLWQQKEQFDRMKIDRWTRRMCRIIYTWILIIPCFRKDAPFPSITSFPYSFFSFFNMKRYYNVAKYLEVRIWNDMEIYDLPFYLYEKCRIAWNESCNFVLSAWHWVNERRDTFRIISKFHWVVCLITML